VAVRDRDELRRLAAQLRSDLEDLARLGGDASAAIGALAAPAPRKLEIYGAGKIVHDVYTGIERAFLRIASALGGVPAGSAWHRTLLEDMALEIREVRPAVIRAATRDALTPYLRFRHLFRNLYAFNLQAEGLLKLLRDVAPMMAALRNDVEGFLAFLDGIGDEG
jgi:hypothetical protein